MNKIKELSSGHTVIAKIVFPTLFYLSMTFAIISLIIEGQYIGALAAFFILLLFGTIIYLGLVRLKRVSVDSEFLYVSNYIKTVKIPLTDIQEVNETWIINIHPIWLTLRQRTEFGNTILFMPTFDITASFSDHSVTKELKKLITDSATAHNTGFI
jgi:hypothetical protein